jgi:hypothetical protein
MFSIPNILHVEGDIDGRVRGKRTTGKATGERLEREAQRSKESPPAKIRFLSILALTVYVQS